MQLQVQEDFMTSCLDFSYDFGTFCIEQFHTDFQEGFFFCEAIQKGIQVFFAVEVTSDDDISVHL